MANSVNFGSNDYFDVALTNYVGSCGWSTPYPTGTNDSGGVLFGNSYLKFAKINDGTSNTLAVGERCYGCPGSTSKHHAATWLGVGRNNSYGNNGTLRTLARNAFIINYDYDGMAGQPQNMGKGCASYHPGGINYLVCDGSVHFLSETTDRANVIRWLSLRNDAQTFPSPW